MLRKLSYFINDILRNIIIRIQMLVHNRFQFFKINKFIAIKQSTKKIMIVQHIQKHTHTIKLLY